MSIRPNFCADCGKRLVEDGIHTCSPAYAVAKADAAQHPPLTDEQINELRYKIDWTAGWSYINFARAIEAAVIDAANSKANAAWRLMCKQKVGAEREACAAIADSYRLPFGEAIAQAIGEDIRARGQA